MLFFITAGCFLGFFLAKLFAITLVITSGISYGIASKVPSGILSQYSFWDSIGSSTWYLMESLKKNHRRIPGIFKGDKFGRDSEKSSHFPVVIIGEVSSKILDGILREIKSSRSPWALLWVNP